MGLRAAFFDVGDTLVEGWDPDYRILARAAVAAHYGERDWYDAFFAADHEAAEPEEPVRQETLAMMGCWFRDQGVQLDGIDLDRVRSLCSVPLDTVARLTAGAPEALRWCKANDLTVVLVTNTLWRGDDEVREDWRRFGLADAIDGVVSSYTVGWRKPHRAMFDRALELAGVRPDEAFMVGDRMRADVWGARQVGLRSVLRKTVGLAPQTPVDVAPDAVVDSLDELPAVVSRWLRE